MSWFAVRLAGGAGVLLVAVAVATALSEGDDAPGGVSPAEMSHPAGAQTTERLVREHLARPPARAVASARGTVRTTRQRTVPARADILSVRVTDGSTVLRWRLATESAMGRLYPGAFSVAGRGADDTSNIALVSTAADVRTLPAAYVQEVISTCTCAPAPSRNGPQGVELSGVYPALPDSITSVDVQVPGFPAMTAPVDHIGQ